MIFQSWSYMYKVLYVLIWVTLSMVSGVPLVGPDIMNFYSFTPASMWHGPVFTSSPQSSGLSSATGLRLDGPDPISTSEIIGGPCSPGKRLDRAGMCRQVFRFPEWSRPGRSHDFHSPTPSPEQIRGDD
ncbi:hypothetical protein SK128_027005 [Halocaridina rubra]|uniref:Uncharacterized protein n=1 Tax=Halocaridina rubra TaxID=373956 RepID=A0AAN8XFS4_HALRR